MRRFPPVESFLLIILAASLSACARPLPGAAGTEQAGHMSHAGLERRYRVYRPAGWRADRPTPLVLALHGGGGDGDKMARLSGFGAVADRHGFLVVSPDGVDRHWNDGRGVEQYRAHREDIDDVGFLAALVDRLAGEYPVDRRRVYVTGVSNGGFMTQRLACEQADLFAAFAPVIATMAENLAAECRPAQAVSLLMINGTEDALVPWEGGHVRFGRRRLGRILSTPATVDLWVGHNRCDPRAAIEELPDRDPADGTRVTRSVYGGCRDGAAVVLYTVRGGGHTWPGGWKYLPEFMIGRTSQDMDASEVIWAFFREHAL